MDNYINTIRVWIQSYVIKLNLCPFASYAFDLDKIHYQSELSQNQTDQLSALWKCIEILNKSDQKTSGILIIPNGLEKLDDYLDLYDKANWLLEDTKLDQKYQLASFHPNYLFENEAPDDISHYTNRSPYPIIHILSVSEVAQAIESHGHTEDIPSNNIQMLKSIGLKKIKDIITATKDS